MSFLLRGIVAILIVILSINAYAQSSRPNIVVILADDLTYNSFAFDGGPAFMQTPNIQRIADEGVRFENFFCTYALCTPSRGTLLTGLYPHNNGAFGAETDIHSNLPTVATILKQNGYYTAMVGKYQMQTNQQPGWDYWLCFPETVDYEDPLMNDNGHYKYIPGHPTDILNDSVTMLIATVDTPFMMWVSHQAPHYPFTAQVEFADIFDSENIYLPANSQPFVTDYPSFLYEEGSGLYYDETGDPINQLYKYYPSAYSLDASTELILQSLEDRGLLNNTLIIFTSDNGRFFGQHNFTNKKLAYDDAMRVPMYIRYPVWFAPNTFVGENIGLNLDLAPTLMEAASIADTFGFQGTSLKKIADESVLRSSFMFEYIPNSTEFTIPSVRAVRSNQYQYNRWRCDEDVEEFFDMINDPLQLHNAINIAGYESLIEEYRQRLDSFQVALVDTLTADSLILACRLEEPDIENELQILQPNPSDGIMYLQLILGQEKNLQLQIHNMLGQLAYAENISAGNNPVLFHTIDVSYFAAGCYLLSTVSGENINTRKFIKN